MSKFQAWKSLDQIKRPEDLTPGCRLRAALPVVRAESDATQGDSSRVLRFTASTGAIDRENDTIAVAGWRLGNFLKNPVFLPFHDRDEVPVGQAVGVELTADALVMSILFAGADVSPLAEQVFQAYRQGFMRAVSVGFIPLRWQFVDDDARGWGVDYLEQELLELSAVTVPALPEALLLPDDSLPPADPKQQPVSTAQRRSASALRRQLQIDCARYQVARFAAAGGRADNE